MWLMMILTSGIYYGDEVSITMSSNAPNLPKFELSPRVCCVTCQKPLVAFQGSYMHIEEPCAGLRDFIYLEAVIEDEFLHEKFENLYGKPELDDYKRIS